MVDGVSNKNLDGDAETLSSSTSSTLDFSKVLARRVGLIQSASMEAKFALSPTSNNASSRVSSKSEAEPWDESYPGVLPGLPDKPGLPYEPSLPESEVDYPIYFPTPEPFDIALTLSGATVIENDRGALIGTLSAESNPWSRKFGYTVDDDRFEVVGGQLKLKAGVALDYEEASEVSVTVTPFYDDDGAYRDPITGELYYPIEGPLVSETFTISVVDVDQEPPEKPMLSGSTVAENQSGAVVGTLYTHDDNDDLITYTVNDQRFEVVSDHLKLKDGVQLDYETEPSVRLIVTASDGTGYIGWSVFDVTVTDMVEDPSLAAEYTATVTDESGAAVLTLETEGAPAYEAVQQAAQRIVATKYEPEGTIGANGQYIEYRMDAEVQSTIDNGDGTYTVTITQEFGRHHANGGGTQSYSNTDTYTVTLQSEEVSQTGEADVEVSADGRFLGDDTTSDVGDGIINGDTTEERIEDLETESALLIWDAITQQSGGEVPRWTAEGWLTVTLGALRESSGVSEEDAALLTPEVLEEFITTNVSADGTVADTIDYSMITPELRIFVRNSVEVGGKLFFSAQQNLNETNPDIAQGSFILPSVDGNEAATGGFLSALQTDIIGDSTSEFVTEGNMWQEFLSSGITSSNEVANGDISDESVVNDSLTKAILWVGKDVIGELDDWDGPSAADFDSATFVDDHKVYSISYTRDEQSFSGLYTQEEFDSLTQEHLDGTIKIDSSGGTATLIGSRPPGGHPGTVILHNITWVDKDGKRHNLEKQSKATLDAKLALHESGDIVITGSHVTSPTTVRMFWAQKALATYDATRNPSYGADGQLTSGASAEVRVARAFNAIYTHNTTTNNVLEQTGEFGIGLGIRQRNGTYLDPLLDTSDISTTVTGTDSDAVDLFYTQLGKIDPDPGEESTGLGRIFGSWQGGTEITSVAGHFAKSRGNHPDHDSFTRVGNGDYAEQAGDNILAALIERGRATVDTPPGELLGYSLSRETATAIKNERWELIFVAGVEVLAVVVTAGGALYVASVEAAVAGGGAAEIEAASSVAAREVALSTGGSKFSDVAIQAEIFARTDLSTTAAFASFEAAASTSGVSLTSIISSASFETGGLLAYGGLLAAGDIATQPNPLAVTDPELAGPLEEPVVQPGRSTVAIYRADGAGGFDLVREFDVNQPATRLGAAGQNLNEQLEAAQIAFQVTEFVADPSSNGVNMALDYLSTMTQGTDSPDIVDVMQWLDKETTDIIEPVLGLAADDAMVGFITNINSLDLTDPDDIVTAAGLINDLTPAVGRAAILYISNNFEPSLAPNVLAAMDPAAAGAIVVFDQSLHLYNQTNRGAPAGPLPSPTEVVEQLLMLTVSDPESAGAILSAAGENDIEVGGHVLESMIRTGVSSNIAKTLVHADPLVASALLNEALQTEQDATPDWTPETSEVLKVVGSLWQAGLDEGMPNQGATITAAFTLTQDVLTEEQEDSFLGTLGTEFKEKVETFATDAYGLFKELYTDAVAHQNAANRLNNLYKFFKGVVLTVKQAAQAGQEIVKDLLGGGNNPDGGPDGDGRIGPVDSSYLTLAVNFLSSVFSGQPQVLMPISGRSPELSGLVIEEVRTEIPNGIEHATMWETQLVATGDVSVLSNGDDFKTVVDNLVAITDIKEDVIHDLLTGGLTLEEGLDGDIDHLTSRFQEALADPTHEHHAEAVEVIQTLRTSLVDANTWTDTEIGYLGDLFDAAETGDFYALANTLMLATTTFAKAIGIVKDGAIHRAAAVFFNSIDNIEDLDKVVTTETGVDYSAEQHLAVAEQYYEEQLKDYVNSEEFRVNLADEGLFADDDGNLRRNDTGARLSSSDEQNFYDRYVRFDFAVEATLDLPNPKNSGLDTSVQVRIFVSTPRIDENGDRFFEFRIRLLTFNAPATPISQSTGSGDLNTGPVSLRDYTFRRYDIDDEDRLLQIEKASLNDDVEAATGEVSSLLGTKDTLENEKTNLELTDLDDATTKLDVEKANIVLYKAEAITNKSGLDQAVIDAYNALEQKFDDALALYEDPAATDAQRQTANTEVDTARAAYDTAANNSTAVGIGSLTTTVTKYDTAVINAKIYAFDVRGLNIRIDELTTKINDIEPLLNAARVVLTGATSARNTRLSALNLEIVDASGRDTTNVGSHRFLSTHAFVFEYGNKEGFGSQGWVRNAHNTLRPLYNLTPGRTVDVILTVADAAKAVTDTAAAVVAATKILTDLGISLPILQTTIDTVQLVIDGLTIDRDGKQDELNQLNKDNANLPKTIPGTSNPNAPNAPVAPIDNPQIAIYEAQRGVLQQELKGFNTNIQSETRTLEGHDEDYRADTQLVRDTTAALPDLQQAAADAPGILQDATDFHDAPAGVERLQERYNDPTVTTISDYAQHLHGRVDTEIGGGAGITTIYGEGGNAGWLVAGSLAGSIVGGGAGLMLSRGMSLQAKADLDDTISSVSNLWKSGDPGFAEAGSLIGGLIADTVIAKTNNEVSSVGSGFTYGAIKPRWQGSVGGVPDVGPNEKWAYYAGARIQVTMGSGGLEVIV